MTVKELIEKLQAMPGDAIVMAQFAHDYSGWHPMTEVVSSSFTTEPNHFGDREYLQASDGEIKAVMLE